MGLLVLRCTGHLVVDEIIEGCFVFEGGLRVGGLRGGGWRVCGGLAGWRLGYSVVGK